MCFDVGYGARGRFAFDACFFFGLGGLFGFCHTALVRASAVGFLVRVGLLRLGLANGVSEAGELHPGSMAVGYILQQARIVGNSLPVDLFRCC